MMVGRRGRLFPIRLFIRLFCIRGDDFLSTGDFFQDGNFCPLTIFHLSDFSGGRFFLAPIFRGGATCPGDFSNGRFSSSDGFSETPFFRSDDFFARTIFCARRFFRARFWAIDFLLAATFLATGLFRCRIFSRVIFGGRPFSAIAISFFPRFSIREGGLSRGNCCDPALAPLMRMKPIVLYGLDDSIGSHITVSEIPYETVA